MNIFQPFSFLLILLAFTLGSCNKESSQKGCLDPNASNYDPSALQEDGSCIYENRQELIYSNGMFWGWEGDLQKGGYLLNVCEGEVKISPYSPDLKSQDSLGTLVVFADEISGSGKIAINLINNQNFQPFRNGNLSFDVRIPAHSTVDVFECFFNGKLAQMDLICGKFNHSGPQGFSTSGINDSTFTTVVLPILDFPNLMLENGEVVFGMKFKNAQPGVSAIELNNIRLNTH